MTIPTHDELMLPFLQVLSDGQEHRINELVDKLAKEFNLSQKEIEEEIPSGERKFAGRVGWARTYLKGAKLIDSPKRAFFIINYIKNQSRYYIQSNIKISSYRKSAR